MGIEDMAMKMITKDPKPGEKPSASRSEREAKIKDKAGLVINVFAALLAFNAWYGGGLSSTVLNNTIKANDIWSFYQAKSMKQTMAEYAMDDAIRANDTKRAEELKARIDRYESEPATGDGKKELMAKAHQIEADRDLAKKKSPWIGYASTAYQLSIVLLSASILAVSMPLFWASFVVAGAGAVLMSQGLWLWLF
jgi:hypothetical protein